MVDGLCDKLIYRHPHVYGDIHADTPDDVKRNWEALKLRKKNRRSGTLGGVPVSLPAMVKALRIGEKAAGAGLDVYKRQVRGFSPRRVKRKNELVLLGLVRVCVN